MPKRRSDWPGVGRKAKRKLQRRHLYFVVDDGDGYAIRKVDLSLDYDDDDAAHHEDGTIEMTDVVSPLPRPLIRLASSTAEFFTASGTKILVTCCDDWPKRAGPAFGVRTRSLTPGPRPPRCPRWPLYMPVGRSLVSLDNGSFAELLHHPPPEHSRFHWSWEELEKAPFRRQDVTCYAAHPDERMLFISTESKGSEATFSLDTTVDVEDGGVWKQHGEWTLPFQGYAHFDPALVPGLDSPRTRNILAATSAPVMSCPSTPLPAATRNPWCQLIPMWCPSSTLTMPAARCNRSPVTMMIPVPAATYYPLGGGLARTRCSARTQARNTVVLPWSTWEVGANTASCSASLS